MNTQRDTGQRFALKAVENNNMTDKPKLGRPKGTTKEPTFKPSLRCRVDHWKALQDKYPRGINKMFNEWIKSLLK